MFPILILLAGTAFAAPVALADSAVLAPQEPKTAETMKAYVAEYFADAPVMVEIARCESHYRHLGVDGEVLRGTVIAADVGVMQINTRYHQEKADEMGLDLHSLKGNLAYARHLYETQGTKPWNASKPCWGKVAIAK